jgi:hypothetical protein
MAKNQTVIEGVIGTISWAIRALEAPQPNGVGMGNIAKSLRVALDSLENGEPEQWGCTDPECATCYNHDEGWGAHCRDSARVRRVPLYAGPRKR